MRFAGLLAAALVTAYAIALTPHLKWMFFCTAMLPTALYQRAVINVDGALLGTTFLVIALCLRSLGDPAAGPCQRGVWTMVTCLTKPSQTVFALLEAMRLPYREWKTHWPIALMVMAPGIILALAWAFAFPPDVRAWRIAEANALPAQEFDPMWKLQFLLR
jgi:Predicted membrane protein (DUF2142)